MYMRTIHLKPHYELPYQKDADTIRGELLDLIEDVEAKANEVHDGYINDIRILFSQVMEISKKFLP